METRKRVEVVFRGVSPVSGGMQEVRGLLEGHIMRDSQVEIVIPTGFDEDVWLVLRMEAKVFDHYRNEFKAIVVECGYFESYRKDMPDEMSLDRLVSEPQAHPWVKIEVHQAPKVTQETASA